MNWRVNLILKKWKLGILEQGMNSSDENKLHFTKIWQTTSTSWYSFWKYSKVQRIEERSGISTRGIFEKKNGRTSCQRCRICTQWIIISRSKSTSVISSSSWTRRIANSRLQCAAKHMGYAWYIGKRLCKSTSVLFDNFFRDAQSLDFSITGNILVRASTERPVIENGDRDSNQSWAPIAKIRNNFSIFRSYFFWFLQRPSTGIPTHFQKKSQEVSGFRETIWGKDRRKGSRGKTVRAVHLKTISTAVLAWMVIARLHLPVNSATSVLGCTIRLMNCQAEAKSDWNSVATLNVHDNWFRMLQDDEPPKSSWRPRKSTKSWVNQACKFTRVTQSGKVHRVGKLVQPSLVAWRACTKKIRDAPAEKRRESKVQGSSTNLFLSAVLRDKCLAASGAHCTI